MTLVKPGDMEATEDGLYIEEIQARASQSRHRAR